MEGFSNKISCKMWMRLLLPTLFSPLDKIVRDTTPAVRLVTHDDELYLAMLARRACSQPNLRCRIELVESDADLREAAKPWPGFVEFCTCLTALATAAIYGTMYGKTIESIVGTLCTFVFFCALWCRRRVIVVHQTVLQHKSEDALRATLHELEAMASAGCGVVLLGSSDYIIPLLPHAILVRLPAREDAGFQRDLFRVLRATQPSPRYPTISTIRAIEGVLGRRALALWLRASPELLDELLAGGPVPVRQLLPLARLLIALEFGARVGAPPGAMEATPGSILYNLATYCVSLKRGRGEESQAPQQPTPPEGAAPDRAPAQDPGRTPQHATEGGETARTGRIRFPPLQGAIPPVDVQRMCDSALDALRDACPNMVQYILEQAESGS